MTDEHDDPDEEFYDETIKEPDELFSAESVTLTVDGETVAEDIVSVGYDTETRLDDISVVHHDHSVDFDGTVVETVDSSEPYDHTDSLEALSASDPTPDDWREIAEPGVTFVDESGDPRKRMTYEGIVGGQVEWSDANGNVYTDPLFVWDTLWERDELVIVE